MEKNRSSKIIAIVALCIAIVGITLGFAAYSSTLNIEPNISVNPTGETFKVNFSSSPLAVETDLVIPTKNPSNLVAENATINNAGSNPEITNLTATFTEPGQSVTYTFYVHNVGEFDAFLKSITYNNANGSDSFRVCTASENTTASLVEAACDDILVFVTVGDTGPVTTTKSNITNHRLVKGTHETVTVKIEYITGGDQANGNFTVKFGDIALLYSSID